MRQMKEYHSYYYLIDLRRQWHEQVSAPEPKKVA
jgi:hypothetical protein